VAALATLPQRFSHRVVCGPTGSGKTRLLAALAAEGAQVLDLEGLARHRGSLLGDIPGDPQPSQKWFESQLLAALQSLDPRRVVYVEAESRKIGDVQLPDALLAAMRASPCVRVELARPLRVALLEDEYAHLLAAPEAIAGRLAHLVPVHGKQTVTRWTEAAAQGRHDALVDELLAMHYDPLYAGSIERNFPRHRDALVATATDISTAGYRALARDVIARERGIAGVDQREG
jgi:tRNA 2-selenouridine synthase